MAAAVGSLAASRQAVGADNVLPKHHLMKTPGPVANGRRGCCGKWRFAAGKPSNDDESRRPFGRPGKC